MDAQTINQTTRLADLVGNLKPHGRYYIGPCPFCGGRDRFNVKRTDYGDRWLCRKCTGGRYQDAIAFLMQRDGRTFPQVLAAYGHGDTAVSAPTRAARRSALDCPPDEDWQAAALAALGHCCAVLQQQTTPVAAATYRYLVNRRGLTPETIGAASLGFNHVWCDVPGVGRLAPGITIPGMINGQLWYVQVRTNGRVVGKYHALAGSRLKALFGADTLLTAHTAVVTEGEFDALLLGQFLPDGAAAVTMGSAGSLPDNPAWLRYFAAVRRVFLVMDNDQAGQTAVSKWRNLLPWVDLLPVPDGYKDVTDYWRVGGNLAAWVGGL
ncbi:MAG: toprim domain-containing protein [Anaerolineae bacterium]|nr:toprim domain-containing protein [Anaerolineae bacterium]